MPEYELFRRSMLERQTRRHRLYVLTLLALAMVTVALLSSAGASRSPSPPECEVVLSQDGTYRTVFPTTEYSWPPRCAPHVIWKETPR